ncbi:hypothetical protein HDU97_003425 [Phlyctochytrium planicorne]|nr:hypothetical protein HDU97_003425 [Phlyctochytrium planicorne]
MIRRLVPQTRRLALRSAIRQHAAFATKVVRPVESSPMQAFERSSAVDLQSPLMTFDILSNTITPGTKLVKSVGNHTFTVNDVTVDGGIVLINNSLLLWDTLQYGVGSAELTESTHAKERVDDPNSVFHQWTGDEFKIFGLIRPLPGIVLAVLSFNRRLQKSLL